MGAGKGVRGEDVGAAPETMGVIGRLEIVRDGVLGAALHDCERWNKQWMLDTKCPQVRLPTPPLLNPLARHRIRLPAFAPIGNRANYPC